MKTGSKRIEVKRVYREASPADGTRVLVDRLWPRGLSKEAAALDLWLRDLAPSDALRKWFHADTRSWSAFRRMYLKELSGPAASAALGKLYQMATGAKCLTLLFASKNEEQNNAVVLKDLLEGMRKPPTGTGPVASGSLRQRRIRGSSRR